MEDFIRKPTDRRFRDLEGQTFGELTVISYAGKPDHDHRWFAHCGRCDKKAIVRANSLVSKTSVTCGCTKQFQDLTGRVFGKLTVLSYIKKEKGHQLWNVRCECGRETICRANNLLTGDSTTCGCSIKVMPGTEVWTCKKCSRTLPFTEEYFHKQQNKAHGLKTTCKDCTCNHAKSYFARTWEDKRRGVIEHYSEGTMACACCGESNYAFLNLDHIHGGGTEELRTKNRPLVHILVAEGLPEDHIQILCYNCNFARSRAPGKLCPHVCPYVPLESPPGPHRGRMNPTVVSESPLLAECNTCTRVLPLTDEFFPAHPRRQHGHTGRCRTCTATVRQMGHVKCYWTRKEAAIAHYSNGTMACKCCGQKGLWFLSLDHRHNDGAEHRRQTKSAADIYSWVQAHGYPDILDVMCMNCNMGRAYGSKGTGICPHLAADQKPATVA